MDRRKKIAVVAVVLALGLAGALEFRRIAPRPSDSLSSDSTWRAAPPRDLSGSFATQSQAPVVRGADGSATAAAQPGGMAALTEAERQMLAGDPNSGYGTAANGGFASAPTSGSGAQALGVVNPLRSQQPSPAPGENPLRMAPVEGNVGTLLVSAAGPDQIHTVADGDTLVKLAQRYLGSGDRYLELFQYNRDVLNDPDVLPIGAEVRIPSRAPDADTLAAIAAARPASGPLVPATQGDAFPPAQQTPPPVASSPSIPQRGTAQPASAGQAAKSAVRTYTVQPGDNLIDISRKLYGDGQHTDALLQANRKLLHSPSDLKPGVVLLVP